MKTALFLLITLIATSVRAEPAFVGMMSTREHGTVFAVVSSPGAVPRWTKVGDTVDGFHVIAYEAKDDILVGEKDGHALRLKLKESKVRVGVTIAHSQLIEEAKKMMKIVEKREPGPDLVFQIANAEDGFLHAYMTNVVDGYKVVRLIIATPEGEILKYLKASEK
jgi:hypothetical protein